MAKLKFLAYTMPVYVYVKGKVKIGDIIDLPDETALGLLETYPRDWSIVGEAPKRWRIKLGRVSVNELKVALPDGIGDAHWTLLKLESMKRYLSAKKLTVITQVTPKHNAAEFLRLIPFVDSVKQEKNTNLHTASRDGWYASNHDLYYLWAFQGIKKNDYDIKKWLPDFEVNYNYPIDIPDSAVAYANKLIDDLGYKPVIFHFSWRGLDTRQVGQHWTEKHFDELGSFIYNHTKQKILIIGKDFEREKVTIFLEKFGKDKYVNLLDQLTVPQLLAVIKQSKFIFGFQSGVTFLSVHFRVPSALLWSINNVTKCSGLKYDKKFMTSFTPPEAENEWYFPCVLGEDSPETIWNKVKHVF